MAKEQKVTAAPGQTVVVVKEKRSLLTKIFGFGCLGIVVIIIIVAVASSAGKDKPTNTFDTASNPTSTQKSEYAVGEEVKQGDITLTVTDVQRNYPGGEFTKPEAGNEFVRINVKLVNGSSTTQSYNPLDFKMQNSTGNRKDYAFVTDVPNQLNYGDLASGGSVVGNIVFEVPKDDKNLKLVYDGSFFSNEVIVKL